MGRWLSTQGARSSFRASGDPAVLNRGHWLAAEISALYWGGEPYKELVSERALTYVGTSFRPGLAGPYGPSLTQTNTSGANGASLAADADDILELDRATIAIALRWRDTTARSSTPFGYSDGASARAQAHLPFSDGTIYWDFGNSTAGSGRVSVALGGKNTSALERFVFVAGPRTGREIWRNGARLANDTGATASRSATTNDFVVGGQAGADHVEIYLCGVWREEWTPAHIRAWSREPFSLLDWRRPRVYIPAAAGGTTVSPDAGQLTLTGYAPVVSATTNHYVIAGLGSLTLTGHAPTITVAAQDQTVSPGAGQLTLEGHAPAASVTTNNYVIPSKGDLTLTGHAPAVIVGISVDPATGQLTLTGYAPTVSVTQNAYVNPQTGALILVGHAPTVANSSAVAVPAQSAGGGGRRRRRWQVEYEDELYEFDSPQDAFAWLQMQEREELKPVAPRRGRPRTRLVRTPQAVFYDGVDVTHLRVGKLTLAESFQASTDWARVRKAMEDYFDDEAAAIAVVLH